MDLWKRTPRAARESLLLQVPGDERLTIREITSRMNAEFGASTERFCAVYEGDIQHLTTRMFKTGPLDRVQETFNETHIRHRYFLERELDGPIAELEQAYRQSRPNRVGLNGTPSDRKSRRC